MRDRSRGHPGGDFDAFVRDVEPRVRRALVAGFGPEIGTDAAAEAMAIAWERWDSVSSRANPAGYVYGIGRNTARRRRGVRLFPVPEPEREPWIEPGLPLALEKLTEQQRSVVMLVHGFGWTHREAAEVLGLSTSSIQSHLERAMRKHRNDLGVES